MNFRQEKKENENVNQVIENEKLKKKKNNKPTVEKKKSILSL